MSLALLAALGGGCAVAFGLVYVVTVRTATGRTLADASLRGAILSRSRAGQLVDQALGVVSVATLLAALAVIALIALVRLTRGLGLAAVGLLAAANLLTRVLKDWVLDRPDLGLTEVAPATLNSMPSGHATAAFSVVVALLFVVPTQWRRWVAVAGGGYACLTALATMAAGWHRAADSVASFLLVGLLAALAAAAYVVLSGPADDPDPGSGRRQVVGHPVVAGIGGAVLLGALLVAALWIAPSIRESTVGLATAFVAGGLFVVATAAAVLFGVLRVLDRIAPHGPGPARVSS